MIDWARQLTVFVELPACPFCGSLRPILIRSEQNGDGSVTRKAICRRCSKPFKICAEPPEGLPDFGRDGFSIDTL